MALRKALALSLLMAASISLPMMAAPAVAQTAPISRTIPVVFSGVVANDVGGSIRIRQPDGSFAAYTGPVPAYPYTKGDAVSISFNAVVPTRDFYTSPAYQGQVAADGIYRIGITGPNNSGNNRGIGSGSNYDVSGPINAGSNFGQPIGSGGLTIVYDSNADNYSIEFPNNRWTAATFDGPSFLYDSSTNTIANNRSTCFGVPGCRDLGDAGFGLSGDADSITTGAIRIVDIANATFGFFNIDFTGSWNLPVYGSSGGAPTDVPEPSMLLLFAGAAAGLVGRQRWRKAIKVT
jgi:hypothetical protein